VYCNGYPGGAGAGGCPQNRDVPNPGRITGIDLKYDCPIRTTAWAYAKTLQGATRSSADMKLVFDTLGIAEDCGALFDHITKTSKGSKSGTRR
jgi:hypothetical protein